MHWLDFLTFAFIIFAFITFAFLRFAFLRFAFSVQPSLPLPADQPTEGEAGRGGQREGDQRLLHRGPARQDRPEEYKLRARQLARRPEDELPQLEADEPDVQPGDQQEVGSSWDHRLLKPSRPRQVEFHLDLHLDFTFQCFDKSPCRTQAFRHFTSAMQNVILAVNYLTGKDVWQVFIHPFYWFYWGFIGF